MRFACTWKIFEELKPLSLLHPFSHGTFWPVKVEEEVLLHKRGFCSLQWIGWAHPLCPTQDLRPWMKVRQHAEHQDPETEAAKWKPSLIFFLLPALFVMWHVKMPVWKKTPIWCCVVWNDNISISTIITCKDDVSMHQPSLHTDGEDSHEILHFHRTLASSSLHY